MALGIQKMPIYGVSKEILITFASSLIINIMADKRIIEPVIILQIQLVLSIGLGNYEVRRVDFL